MALINGAKILNNRKETKRIKTKKISVTIRKKEEELNSEVTKLQDDEYVAKYAREKYMYSKDGEYIIKIAE
ncbi:MAG: septum formation initiator family protein [Clostridium sp.]|nr:MAG: septum formation initiator family protein [Clostridium sp.]